MTEPVHEAGATGAEDVERKLGLPWIALPRAGSVDDTFAPIARLAPEKLLLRRPLVNRNACLAADARCKELLGPSPQARSPIGLFRMAKYLRRQL
jgi:hypothetical protein